MTRFCILLVAILAVAVAQVSAQGPDDQYVQIYQTIQQADQLKGTGQSDMARDKYHEAQAALKRLQSTFPTWNPKVIQFRLNYVEEKLDPLLKLRPAASAPPTPAAPAAPEAEAKPSPALAEKENQIRGLNDEVARLHADRSLLEAKLKEALSAQPASMDPRELTKAEEKIKTLEKEKDLLKVSFEQMQIKQAKLIDSSVMGQTQKALAETNHQLEQQKETIAALTQERSVLQTRLQAVGEQEAAAKLAQAERESLKSQLADLKRSDRSAALEKELISAKAAAQANAASAGSLQTTLTALREEKAAVEKERASLLEKLLAASSVAAKPGTDETSRIKRLEKERDQRIAALQRELRVAQAATERNAAAMATLQSNLKALREERAAWQSEKAALQVKLNRASNAAKTTKPTADESSRIKQVEKERDAKIALLQKDLTSAKATAESNTTAMTALQSNLKALREEKAAWEKEKASLRARLAESSAAAKTSKPSADESSRIKQLEKERDAKIALLQKDLSSAKTAADSKALAVKGLESALKTMREEKSALEKEKATWQVKAAAPAASVKPGARESSRVKQLEDERDELLKKLNAAAKELYDNKARGESSPAGQLTNEIAAMRARLDVYESKKAPFTPEELALFKTTPLVAAETDPNAGKKPSKEPPAGAGLLLAEAQRAFAARRYDEAEKKYLQVLKLDERNVFTLANLASIQMEQNRLEDAETNLKLALREDANDAFSLFQMGILKFRQEKYDEALDTLSRAAQLDPKNPETQNYLGITLSQKGQRGPAEAALRKAIQLAPGYAVAHHNLAVIYASQQPPFLELARWHYQKALATGHAENPELEKLLNPPKAPPGDK